MKKWLFAAAAGIAMFTSGVEGATREDVGRILTSGTWCAVPHNTSQGLLEFLRFNPPTAEHQAYAMSAVGSPQQDGSLAFSWVGGALSHRLELGPSPSWRDRKGLPFGQRRRPRPMVTACAG